MCYINQIIIIVKSYHISFITRNNFILQHGNWPFNTIFFQMLNLNRKLKNKEQYLRIFFSLNSYNEEYINLYANFFYIM